MYQSSGIFLALLWGMSAGIITSIPLGPTGALVLSSAVRDSRKGIFCAVAGLASAQIVFQTIYHLGFSSYLLESPRAVVAIGTTGIVVTSLFGVNHLLRARKMISAGCVKESPHLNATFAASSKPFVKALGAALFNPFLLIYIMANVSMFVTSFPTFSEKGYIVVLLFGGLLGTVFWYLFFGEMVRRHAVLWGEKGKLLAEITSGLLMLAAGIFLYFRL